MIDLSWTDLKVYLTNPGATASYIITDISYLISSNSSSFVTYVFINGDSDQLDFETNYKDTIIQLDIILNIAKAEDVASANADAGVPAMAIRKATPVNTSDTDGDYEMLQISAGRLWTSTVIDESSVLFKGRSSTFNTPGRAGTAGQKILSLHNATGSSVIVTINKVFVDLSQTVIKAVTVAPPIIRLWKVTVLPTNGTTLTKNKIGGTTTSSSSVTLLQDASADGTGSGTTLTATLPAGTILSQEYAPRFITAVGYEPADRMEFLGDTKITLGPLEGVVVFLSYTLATQNPTTDRWIAGIEWTEQ